MRHLIEDRGADPATVTALAFNTKAAEEMRDRCGRLVTARGPHIRTLNSLGFSICNGYGGQGRLGVYEEPQVRDLIGEVFEVRRQAGTRRHRSSVHGCTCRSPARPDIASDHRG